MSIKIDFVGLNTYVYEPITGSTNTLGYPSGTTTSGYMNLSIGTIAESGSLNALLLHRYGPYQNPTWKQLRVGEHPILRMHKQNSVITVLEDSPDDLMNRTGQFVVNKAIRDGQLRQFVDPVVTKKFKPIVHVLSQKTTFSNPRSKGADPVSFPAFLYSHGNKLAGFANDELTRIAGYKNCDRTIYDDITELYLGEDVLGSKNPVNEFKLIIYKERVFPKEKYETLAQTRKRLHFKFKNWSDNINDRQKAPTTLNTWQNPINKGLSKWFLDGRLNFETATAFELNAGAAVGTQGELMNDYSIYHAGTTSNLTGSVLYARPIPTIDATDSLIYISGDSKWEVGEQAGRNPGFNDYDAFLDSMKFKGQDFSIVPEFRISEHMETYVNTHNANFSADIESVFSLTGSGTKDDVYGDSANDSFFDVYNTTDIFKNLPNIKRDHKELANKLKLDLKCTALMRLLPYDGFFPAERGVQLAKLFSSSFAPHVTLAGGDANFKTFMAPMFGPGVFFNTIKSCLAVDHPITTGSHFKNWYEKDPGGVVSSMHAMVDPWHYRVPFEALVDPRSFYAKIPRVTDYEMHESASLNSTASWSGQGSYLYELAMHNFLAEIPNFFLKSGKLTSFSSLPDNDPNFGVVDPDKEYIMDVIISKGDVKAFTQASLAYDTGTIDIYKKFDGGTYVGNITGAAALSLGGADTSGSSFGPPSTAFVSPSTVYNVGFSPHTPPYYEGTAWARMTFRPYKTDSNKYSLQEIVSNITSSYYRYGRKTGVELGVSIGRESYSVPNKNSSAISSMDRMEISSSVNLFGSTNAKALEYDQQGNIAFVKEDNSLGSQWVIHTKFETPVLDFRDASFTEPAVAPQGTSIGMWHQYGTLPSADNGLFLALKDAEEKTLTDPATTGSLASLVGFTPSTSRVGDVANTKEIKEAVIAIPYLENNGNREFFTYDKRIVDNILRGATDFQFDSRVEAINSLKDYVLPPRFNFIDGEADPIDLYVFEFKYELDQKALTDIWQNVMPDISIDFQQSEISIENEEISRKMLSNDVADLKWLVFKAKRKAEKNYYNTVAASLQDSNFNKSVDASQDLFSRFAYSYNYPYDYFSLVELIKLDAEVKLES